MKKYFVIFSLALLTSCTETDKKSDAYGNFEAIEYLVSAEASGKIISLTVDEGALIKAGQRVGVVDTVPLMLKKEQLQAQIEAVKSRIGNVSSQIDVQLEQKKTLEIEKKRIEKLVKDNAIPAKQLDDLNGKISVLESQIKSIETQNAPISSEINALETQYKQIDDQLKKCRIINPVDGTVLEQYAEAGEVTMLGKTLYKIADLSSLNLRIYVSGDQLSEIKIGQKVKVLIDAPQNRNKTMEGEIAWISQEAEFTPKIIQTKEDRVNLVYAMKVKVKNDGSLKIGMPGEVVFK